MLLKRQPTRPAPILILGGKSESGSLNLPPRVPEEIEAELKGVSEIKANYMKHADSASTRFSIKSLEEAQLELRQELERANAILQKITV